MRILTSFVTSLDLEFLVYRILLKQLVVYDVLYQKISARAVNKLNQIF